MTSAAVCTGVGDADPEKEKGGGGEGQKCFFQVCSLQDELLLISLTPQIPRATLPLRPEPFDPTQTSKENLKKTMEEEAQRFLQAKSNFRQAPLSTAFFPIRNPQRRR